MLAVLGLPGMVDAQSPSAAELATARGLFHEGTAAAEVGDWAEARDAFARAYALVEELSILFNLAAAHEQLGELVEASEYYRLFVRQSVDAALVEQAQASIDSIAPRLAHLTIRIPDLQAGDSVTVNEEEFSRDLVGARVPMNPGAYEVRARCQQGGIVGVMTVTLEEGDEREIGIEIERPTPIETPREVAERALPTSPASTNTLTGAVGGSQGVSPWVWVGVSTGVLAVAATVTLVLLSGPDVPEGSFEGPWQLD